MVSPELFLYTTENHFADNLLPPNQEFLSCSVLYRREQSENIFRQMFVTNAYIFDGSDTLETFSAYLCIKSQFDKYEENHIKAFQHIG